MGKRQQHAHDGIGGACHAVTVASRRPPASSRVDDLLRDLDGVFFSRTIEHYDTSTSQLNIGACNLDDNGLRLCLPEAPSWHANYFGCL